MFCRQFVLAIKNGGQAVKEVRIYDEQLKKLNAPEKVCTRQCNIFAIQYIGQRRASFFLTGERDDKKMPHCSEEHFISDKLF